ncbi:MAG: radical SAM family heme chaperone HemW [Candidatus Hinthialibacter antarcticus]|nr:radical SAM family heme chaperone HemW [Candidatus Hinthialibacter antarcticus]
MPLGLYLHLPYCKTKCTYCSFVSGAPRSDEEIDRYLDALIVHLQSGAGLVDGREISTVFLGGGTPSLMGAERLARLFEAVHNAYAISSTAEITIEANPESATQDLFERLRPLGLNRVSLGVQSFHDDELQWLGRVHSVDGVYRAVEAVRGAGIDNLSLDLIFGLPNQSEKRWAQSVERAIECDIDHFSSYALSYEDGTLLDRLLQQNKVTPADDERYESMYNTLREMMAQAGFEQYELSNWARPGKRCEHNCIYWRRDEYLAFGVSAHGWFDGLRYGLERNPNRYVELIEKLNASESVLPFGEEMLDEQTMLSSDEAASDAMIFGLRLTQGVDVACFATRYGYPPQKRWGEVMKTLQARGLIDFNSQRIWLAPDAYFISNEALMYFL